MRETIVLSSAISHFIHPDWRVQKTVLNNENTSGNKDSGFNRTSLSLYFIVATAITSAFWIPSSFIAASNGYLMPSPVTFVELAQNGFKDTTHVLTALIFSIGVYGPLISAMYFTYKRFGNAGTSDLMSRITRWRVDKKWYLAALIVPFIITVPAILAGLFSGMPFQMDSRIPVPLLVPFILWQLVTSGLEEPGWRGYALPELQKKYNADTSSWRLGIMWSIWHWPYLVFLYASTIELPSEIPPEMVGVALGATILISLFQHALSTAGISFVYTWLYNNTESVFICIVFHAFTNLVTTYVQFILPHQGLSVVLGIMPWIIAFALRKQYGKETLTGLS